MAFQCCFTVHTLLSSVCQVCVTAKSLSCSVSFRNWNCFDTVDVVMQRRLCYSACADRPPVAERAPLYEVIRAEPPDKNRTVIWFRNKDPI